MEPPATFTSGSDSAAAGAGTVAEVSGGEASFAVHAPRRIALPRISLEVFIDRLHVLECEVYNGDHGHQVPCSLQSCAAPKIGAAHSSASEPFPSPAAFRWPSRSPSRVRREPPAACEPAE